MKTNIKINEKAPTEAVEDVQSLGDTQVLPEVENVSTVSIHSLETIPDIIPLINVHISPETRDLLEEVVARYPNKVEKIALYVNRVPEDQLALIFSTPHF